MPIKFEQFDFVKAMADGFSLTPDGPWASRQPAEGDEATTCLVTIARRKDAAKTKCPTSYNRAETGAFVSKAVQALQLEVDEVQRNKKRPVEEVEWFGAVFKEPHTGGPAFVPLLAEDPPEFKEYHFHVVLHCPDGCAFFHKLAERLRNLPPHFDADIRVPVEAERDNLGDVLRYVMVPTSAKFLLDASPFFSVRFPVPRAAVVARKAEYAKLSARSATPTEMLSLVCQHPAATAVALRDAVDKAALLRAGRAQVAAMKAQRAGKPPPAPEYNGVDVPLQRVGAFFTKPGKPLETVGEMIARRDRLKFADCIGQPFSFFVDAAMQTECTCSEFGQALMQNLKTIARNTNEKLFQPKVPGKIVGHWASQLYHDNFTTRRQTLLIIGRPGTGKTTVAKTFEALYQPFFVFNPVWDDSWPFGAMSSQTLMLSMQDFRFDASISRGAILNLLERHEKTQVAVKGGAEPTIIQGNRLCICVTANYVRGGGTTGFKAEDVEAFEDRCSEAVVLAEPIPDEEKSGDVLHSRCRLCAVRFVCACVEMAGAPELKKGAATKAKKKAARSRVGSEQADGPGGGGASSSSSASAVLKRVQEGGGSPDSKKAKTGGPKNNTDPEDLFGEDPFADLAQEVHPWDALGDEEDPYGELTKGVDVAWAKE